MLVPCNFFSVKIPKKSASNAYFLRHAAKMHQKCIKSVTCTLQEAPKTLPGRPKTDFASVLGANLGPSWSHVGHFSRPRRFHDASKTIPRAPQNPIQPGLDQNRGTPSARAIWGRFLIDFWSIFGRFLVDFCSLF